MDTSIGESDMIGSKHIMNGSDESIGKVDLMKVSESQRVDNSLDKDKSTCLKNQDKMITQSVVANQDGRFETLNGYGVNMNSITKAIKIIINSKLK